MKPCPRIVTFVAAGYPDTWCARFWVGAFLPMIFDGPTEDAVTDAAREWWRAETAKEDARREAGRRVGLGRRSA